VRTPRVDLRRRGEEALTASDLHDVLSAIFLSVPPGTTSKRSRSGPIGAFGTRRSSAPVILGFVTS
jgi:hypothetical protein